MRFDVIVQTWTMVDNGSSDEKGVSTFSRKKFPPGSLKGVSKFFTQIGATYCGITTKQSTSVCPTVRRGRLRRYWEPQTNSRIAESPCAQGDYALVNAAYHIDLWIFQ